MGQRSLTPGQCPGLPGFGYATAIDFPYTISMKFPTDFPYTISMTFPTDFFYTVLMKFQIHFLYSINETYTCGKNCKQ